MPFEYLERGGEQRFSLGRADSRGPDASYQPRSAKLLVRHGADAQAGHAVAEAAGDLGDDVGTLREPFDPAQDRPQD
jgi:hypothetical protein